MRVYISAPYSAPTEKERLANVQVAIDAGRELMRLGHQPFLPTLSHHVDPHNDFGWDRWIDWCLTWVPCCDSLLLLGKSRGCLVEMYCAERLGIPVYHSVDEFDMVED